MSAAELFAYKARQHNLTRKFRAAGPTGGDARIIGAAVAVLIEGKRSETATTRLSPTKRQPAGIIELQLDPPTVLIGSMGFGLEFPGSADKPGAFVIDDSSDSAPAGRTVLNGTVVATRADDPAWRGISVRRAPLSALGVPCLVDRASEAPPHRSTDRDTQQ